MTPTPPQRRHLEISSCIQCPFCMVDTSIVTTHNNEVCNFTVPYWSTKLPSHDTIPDWCPLPYQSERDTVLDKLDDELKEMGCYGDVCCLEYFKKVVKGLHAADGDCNKQCEDCHKSFACPDSDIGKQEHNP